MPQVFADEFKSLPISAQLGESLGAPTDLLASNRIGL